MSNFSSGDDEGIYGYVGAYPFFAADLESERGLDGDVDGGADGSGDGSGNGNQMGRPRQHVRQISSATTLIVTREEEEDERDKVKVPEKVLIIGRSGMRDVDVNGDGDVRGEKNDNTESGLGLGLQRNTSGFSMGGLEVLVRDEDIGGIGSEGGDVAVGRFGDANGVEEAGEGEGERIGKVLRWDEVGEFFILLVSSKGFL
ncbi:hypothetical protein ACHAP3_004722 [Botrytis cinerea]